MHGTETRKLKKNIGDKSRRISRVSTGESYLFTYEAQANQDRMLLENRGILLFRTLAPGCLISRSCGVWSLLQDRVEDYPNFLFPPPSAYSQATGTQWLPRHAPSESDMFIPLPYLWYHLVLFVSYPAQHSSTHHLYASIATLLLMSLIPETTLPVLSDDSYILQWTTHWVTIWAEWPYHKSDTLINSSILVLKLYSVKII